MCETSSIARSLRLIRDCNRASMWLLRPLDHSSAKALLRKLRITL
jgi:hypothetical protein